MNELATKVALIGGGTAGIGLAMAKRFLAAGATVVINGRDEERGTRALESLSEERAFFEPGDCTDPDQTRTLAGRVSDRHGRLDILVASGGAAETTPALFETIKSSAFEDVYRTQFLNRVFLIRAALPLMKATGGSIVIVGTDAGRHATVGEALHGGMGAAKIMLTKTLAREFARWNIRVNGLALTVTSDTDAFQAAMARQDWVSELYAKAIRRFPGGRPPRADEVAEVALFLASSRSSQVNGQTLSVNGGLSFGGW